MQAQPNTRESKTDDTELLVTGMHCSSCEHHIESALLALPGVVRVEVDRRAGRVRIDHGSTVTASHLIRAIEEQGYLATIA